MANYGEAIVVGNNLYIHGGERTYTPNQTAAIVLGLSFFTVDQREVMSNLTFLDLYMCSMACPLDGQTKQYP